MALLVGGAAFFHFSRHYAPNRLTPDGMDLVQAARIMGRTRKFSTNIVRPIVTSRFAVNGDGTSPDFAHAPLYVGVTGLALRLTRQTGPGQGDRTATLVALAVFLLSVAVCGGVARALFGSRHVLLACLLYALAGGAMSQALLPHPALLAAVWFTGLLGALWRVDALVPAGDDPRRPALGWAALAGGLYGLLFLTIYSALALLPVVVFYLWRVSRGDRGRAGRTVAVFLVVTLLVCAPLLVRNIRLAHNPLYNSRLLEMVMHTDTFPGYGLDRVVVMPRTLSQYLTGGGVGEIGRKAWNNLLEFYARAPLVIGLFLFPLWVMAALTRFTDGRINRLRGLVYGCVFFHIAGLSLFQPATENTPLLLMYAPWAAMLGATFFLTLIRARQLPRFYARVAVWAWMGVACLPGVAQMLSAAPPPDEPYAVWGTMNLSPQMVRLRASGGASYVLSDAPWEAAYRLDVPVVWLPAESADMEGILARTGKPVSAIVLTPDLPRLYRGDPAADAWTLTYDRIISLSKVLTLLDAPLRLKVIQNSQRKLFYPAPLSSGMQGFVPEPFSERNGAEFSLMLWKDSAIAGTKTAPRATR